MADGDITVQVEHVGLRVGDKWLLDGISFECRAGEWTLLYGPSGSGKSTLLRAINGLRLPTTGSIRTLGARIPGRSRREARAVWRQTGTVLQEIALFETRTARQNVELALRTVGLGVDEARRRAQEWLERLGLGDKMDSYPCHLSGGQCQRVALARAFAVEPRLLVMDEPTSALDVQSASTVFEAVQELVARGTTAIMSSHRVDEINELCDQSIAMQNGHVVSVDRRASSHPPAVFAHGVETGDVAFSMRS